ncbi:MAG: class I SAM-dependent methyltransferase [Deltaproteobacteria bacterium]|nr:class I SAM-dependent methyltransferase [Deltaproteobacteria bacterium]
MEKLRWLSRSTPVAATCPCCGNDRDNAVVLQALHWMPERGMLDLARCPRCASAFFPDIAAHVDYPSSGQSLDDPEFVLLLHHHLELVSGLDWKVPLLEQLPFDRFASVLEIGCNVGVALDYCRAAWGADVVGLEPSAYGLGGAKLLGLPIYQRLLSDAPELGDRRFDLVYATSVLEHAADPIALLEAMRQRLTRDGVLLLTTPRAEILTRETRPGDLYATLSAGARRFIPSGSALLDMVQRSGFSHVRASSSGDSHVVIASDAPVERPKRAKPAERVARYYRARTRDRFADPRVELGFHIDAYAWSVKIGREIDAAELVRRIDVLLRGRFGLTLARPLEVPPLLSACSTFFDFGRVVPYGLPNYLRAQARVLRPIAPVAAATFEALAAVVCAHGLRVDFQSLSGYREVLDEALAAVRAAPALSKTGAALREAAEAAIALVPELSASRLAARPSRERAPISLRPF